jgi:uncharacterized protein (TIGR00369 family)
MSSDERRVRAASLLRELGHEFVARDIDDEQLEVITRSIDEILVNARSAPLRQRSVPSGAIANFKMAVPRAGEIEKLQLFSDSIVSGGANPMGLNGVLWREDDDAVMEVTLGKAFEGAPGRAHGGIVAALIDETMGLVLAMSEVLAFTVQLDISYLAPTPINEPLQARATLVQRVGRKLSIEATVRAQGKDIAKASALFIAVDPEKFLEYLAKTD